MFGEDYYNEQETEKPVFSDDDEDEDFENEDADGGFKATYLKQREAMEEEGGEALNELMEEYYKLDYEVCPLQFLTCSVTRYCCALRLYCACTGYCW